MRSTFNVAVQDGGSSQPRTANLVPLGAASFAFIDADNLPFTSGCFGARAGSNPIPEEEP